MKLRLSPRARRDLIEIGDYLAEVAGKRLAKRWVNRLESRAKTLLEFPFSAVAHEELGGRRILQAAPYVIIYQVTGKDIFVNRIVHGARDLPRLFQTGDE